MARDTKHLKPFQFKPGQTGNPLGGKLMNPAIRALSKLTVEIYREVIELALTGNVDALHAVADHPDTPAIQVGIAKALLRAINEGDYTIIERLAEKLVGKTPDNINIMAIHGHMLNPKIAQFDETQLKEAIKKLEEDV